WSGPSPMPRWKSCASAWAPPAPSPRSAPRSRNWGCLLKKTLHASEQDRPDIAQRRARWVLERAGIDPRRLIFIDETWAKTNMTRLRGRALLGERLVDKVPHGHWKTTTLIGALSIEGVRCSTVVDGAINAAVFT